MALLKSLVRTDLSVLAKSFGFSLILCVYTYNDKDKWVFFAFFFPKFCILNSQSKPPKYVANRLIFALFRIKTRTQTKMKKAFSSASVWDYLGVAFFLLLLWP